MSFWKMIQDKCSFSVCVEGLKNSNQYATSNELSKTIHSCFSLLLRLQKLVQAHYLRISKLHLILSYFSQNFSTLKNLWIAGSVFFKFMASGIAIYINNLQSSLIIFVHWTQLLEQRHIRQQQTIYFMILCGILSLHNFL